MLYIYCIGTLIHAKILSLTALYRVLEQHNTPCNKQGKRHTHGDNFDRFSTPTKAVCTTIGVRRTSQWRGLHWRIGLQEIGLGVTWRARSPQRGPGAESMFSGSWGEAPWSWSFLGPWTTKGDRKFVKFRTLSAYIINHRMVPTVELTTTIISTWRELHAQLLECVFLIFFSILNDNNDNLKFVKKN